MVAVRRRIFCRIHDLCRPPVWVGMAGQLGRVGFAAAILINQSLSRKKI